MADFAGEMPKGQKSAEAEQALCLVMGGGGKREQARGYKEVLRRAGLRFTRQRLVLGKLLFSKGNRHVTAEMVHHEATEAKIPVSLATIYNTLHQFTRAGLLREIAFAGPSSFFDTNPNDHHHFFVEDVEDEESVIDIPQSAVIDRLPAAPPGYEIARVDVVVRLRRNSR